MTDQNGFSNLFLGENFSLNFSYLEFDKTGKLVKSPYSFAQLKRIRQF